MQLLSGIVVVAFAFFLLGLAVMTYAHPSRAGQFLHAFARSARAHYGEQAARLLTGGALVLFSSEMWQPELFRLFGWILVITTVGLLCVPWRWHRRFAQRVVPPVIQHMKLFGFGAVVLAALLLYSVFVPWVPRAS